jgi:hypothetical protein
MFSPRALIVALIAVFGAMNPSLAQEPQRGGALVFGLSAEPPTYDCNQSLGGGGTRLEHHAESLSRPGPARRMAGALRRHTAGSRRHRHDVRTRNA